jgi:putative membrane protein insertion efficiency factor
MHHPGTRLSSIPGQFGRALVRIYRYTLSPVIGPRCRHMPSCSEYGEEAMSRFGLWAGGWMTLARILRCHPWGTHGLDFVPAHPPADARWYLPWRYGRWRGTNPQPACQPELRR